MNFLQVYSPHWVTFLVGMGAICMITNLLSNGLLKEKVAMLTPW